MAIRMMVAKIVVAKSIPKSPRNAAVEEGEYDVSPSNCHGVVQAIYHFVCKQHGGGIRTKLLGGIIGRFRMHQEHSDAATDRGFTPANSVGWFLIFKWRSTV